MRQGQRLGAASRGAARAGPTSSWATWWPASASCESRPIPFFENASFAFAEEEQRLFDPRRRREPGAELAAARRAYAGDPRYGQKGDLDAATLLLWRGREPLEEPAFAAWAARVFRPLLEARRELRL